MRKLFVFFIALAVLATVFGDLGYAQGKGKFQYIGAAKCKMCHNSPKKGAQFKKWQESKHSKAYETLASPEAKKIAKEKGIADPQKSDVCLKCHVTGHGQPKTMFAASFKPTEGVGCEACHGPGSEYKSMKVMKDLYAGKIDGASVGFKKATEADCKKCHNPESPTYKEFNFAEFWKKIDHSMPKK